MFDTLTWPMASTVDTEMLALLRAVHEGDAAAQAEFFERHKLVVARQVLRMTGDAGLVDDIVQDVFIVAFSRLGQFRGDASITTWLHRITVNKVRNAWDSRSRRRARETTVANNAPQAVQGPDVALEAGERLQEFYDALGGLPAKYRDAFVCRVLEQMSLEQASALLSIPISTVSYRARRAEALLCERLDIERETS